MNKSRRASVDNYGSMPAVLLQKVAEASEFHDIVLGWQVCATWRQHFRPLIPMVKSWNDIWVAHAPHVQCILQEEGVNLFPTIPPQDDDDDDDTQVLLQQKWNLAAQEQRLTCFTHLVVAYVDADSLRVPLYKWPQLQVLYITDVGKQSLDVIFRSVCHSLHTIVIKQDMVHAYSEYERHHVSHADIMALRLLRPQQLRFENCIVDARFLTQACPTLKCLELANCWFASPFGSTPCGHENDIEWRSDEEKTYWYKTLHDGMLEFSGFLCVENNRRCDCMDLSFATESHILRDAIFPSS